MPQGFDWDPNGDLLVASTGFLGTRGQVNLVNGNNGVRYQVWMIVQTNFQVLEGCGVVIVDTAC